MARTIGAAVTATTVLVCGVTWMARAGNPQEGLPNAAGLIAWALGMKSLPSIDGR